MNLKSIKVNDLPLSSYVSHTNDIQSYVTNVLSGKSYSMPNDFMNAPIAQMLSSMMTALSTVIKSFGGKIQTYDVNNAGEIISPIVFTVTFVDENGNVIKHVEVQEHDDVNENDIPAAPAKNGYIFREWSHALTDITSNLQVRPQYDEIQVEKCSVKFWDQISGYVEEIEVNPGEDVMLDDIPVLEKLGYTFNGWQPSPTNITSNITLSSQWTANEYTVTFNLGNEGTIIGEINEQNQMTVIYGQQYGTLPSAHYDGHTFNGWYLSNDQILSNTIVSTAYDHALSARWTTQLFNVKFIDWDGTVVKSEDVSLNSNATPPANECLSTKTGYSFIAWSNELYNNVTADVEVSANYQPMSYHIAFNPNGGQLCGNSEIVVAYDSNYGIMPSATFEEHEFIGWYLDENTQILSSTKMTTPFNHVLSAHWTRQNEDNAWGDMREVFGDDFQIPNINDEEENDEYTNNDDYGLLDDIDSIFESINNEND